MADGEAASGDSVVGVHVNTQKLWSSAPGHASCNPSTDVGGVQGPALEEKLVAVGAGRAMCFEGVAIGRLSMLQRVAPQPCANSRYSLRTSI